MDKIKIKDVNFLLLIVLPLTFLIVSPFSHILMMIIILAWVGINELRFN